MLHLPDGTLHIKHRNTHTIFTHYISKGNEHNINKQFRLIHQLARKKYLTRLIPLLEAESDISVPATEIRKLKKRVDELLNQYKNAGLQLTQITLTPKQYQWMHEKYRSNPSHRENLKYATPSGILLRSKSERLIGERYEFIGAPYRYEMPMEINVSKLVACMEKYFYGQLRGQPLYFLDPYGYCVWNVPDEFQWMNYQGSVWRLYNPKTGTITIYPDFTSLTIDNELIIHEHEGVCDDPRYRSNASERVFLMRHSGAVREENLIVTFERDLEDINVLTEMLERRVLSRI